MHGKIVEKEVRKSAEKKVAGKGSGQGSEQGSEEKQKWERQKGAEKKTVQGVNKGGMIKEQGVETNVENDVELW